MMLQPNRRKQGEPQYEDDPRKRFYLEIDRPNHMQMQTTVKGNDPRYKPVMKKRTLVVIALFCFCLACAIGLVILVWKG